MASDLLTSKIISLTLLGILSLFFGLVPFKVKKRLMQTDNSKSLETQKRQRRRRELTVSCLLCFGAGVLLATVFLHMLPETRENLGVTKAAQRRVQATERAGGREGRMRGNATEGGEWGLEMLGGEKQVMDKGNVEYDHSSHGDNAGNHDHLHHDHGHGHDHQHRRKRSQPKPLSLSPNEANNDNLDSSNNSSDPIHDHADHSLDHSDPNHVDHSHNHFNHSHDHTDHIHDHADHSHNHSDPNHVDHSHDHFNHSHDHTDHIHDHADHSHNHSDPNHVDHSHDHLNHSHDHTDHIHDHADHSHNHSDPNHVDHSHDHFNHSHDHTDHIHDHADHSHNHSDPNHVDHSHDHFNHSHDHTDHIHDHADHSHNHSDPNHVDHSHDHLNHSHDHTDHIHDHSNPNHNHAGQSHNDSDPNYHHEDHSHDHTDHSHDHEDNNQNNFLPSAKSAAGASLAPFKPNKTATTSTLKGDFRSPSSVNKTQTPSGLHDLVEAHEDSPTEYRDVDSNSNFVGAAVASRSSSGHLNDQHLHHHGPYERLRASLAHSVLPADVGNTHTGDTGLPPHREGVEEVGNNEMLHRIAEPEANNDNESRAFGDGHFHDGHNHDGHDHGHGHEHGGDEEAHEYPLAELLICVGFFFIYLVEELVHKVVFRQHTKTTTSRDPTGGEGSIVLKNRHSLQLPNGTEGVYQTTSLHRNPFPSLSSNSQNGHVTCKEYAVASETGGRGYNASNGGALYPSGGRSNGCLVTVNGGLPPKEEWATSGVVNPVFTTEHETETQMPNNGSDNSAHSHGHSHAHSHGHSHMADLNKLRSASWASNLRSLIVVVALSFHAVFEGLAVGLQQQVQDVWYLFYAIASHKFVIAFCVGLELIVGGTRPALCVVYMAVFALVTPLGIGIGIIITEGTDSPDSIPHLWTLTALQGLAGGTILYVTFCEVLERERARKDGRFLKLAALALGFVTMAVIEGAGGHKHSH